AIAEQLIAVRQFRDQTNEVETRLADLSRTFAIGYGLIMVLLLLGAMWIGIIVANAIIGPVRRLATAAGAVSEGDLTSRVEIRKGDGELGELGEAFNEMTRQLAGQRDDLIAANEQSDARRRFIETVISGVPAGVLNVRNDGRVALANPSAERLLEAGPGRANGALISDVLPELEGLMNEARAAMGRDVRDQIELTRGGLSRIINVRISPDDPELPAGFLITLDDITELISAQRNAAWGDVARRIAHEIKNPLTPIQLSAERLRRRYGKKLGEDREVFDICTETIIRHVGDIGRMVTEFSSFARMPEPILANVDLREIARSSAFSFSVANPNIDFVFEIPEEPVMAHCDGRLVGQAVVNLVKNAVEAILEGDTPDQGQITVRVETGKPSPRIEIIDNGRGLPKKDRARLTEPYMTTRAKGTGLGLAIVRKAVEEHGGRFELLDRGGEGQRGALARITLPPSEITETETEQLPQSVKTAHKGVPQMENEV
ncbi:MAG: ATP-binding protein, partial [Pseudomonadota bacterium]